jgi:hypothetical protein
MLVPQDQTVSTLRRRKSTADGFNEVSKIDVIVFADLWRGRSRRGQSSVEEGLRQRSIDASRCGLVKMVQRCTCEGIMIYSYRQLTLYAVATYQKIESPATSSARHFVARKSSSHPARAAHAMRS